MDDLLNYSLTDDPLASFLKWFEEASAIEQNAEAMAVSTIDPIRNRPSVRYLLYKGVAQKKIMFYTNYLSPKAQDLDTNPEIALAFYWPLSKKQVRINGRVKKMERVDSERYFHSRDRASQIASYLSLQSHTIKDKDELLKKFKDTEDQFLGKTIPLPDHWGGFLVDPYEYEFFLYGANRLNDRFLYTLNNSEWEVQRLEP